MADPIAVTTRAVHETRHTARIEGDHLRRIIAEAVATAAGINLDAPGVTVRLCSIGGPSHAPRAEVEIHVAHPPGSRS
jgi:hypothetical protein